MTINTGSTHRISGLAKQRNPEEAPVLSTAERYQNEVLVNPLKPMEDFPAFFQRISGLSEDQYPASVQDVRNKMETYITTLGFGDYVSDRNRPEIINEARRRGKIVISADSGAQTQSVLFDAYMRALYSNEHESILCIKIIHYYTNAYLKKLFAPGTRFSFFDRLNKTREESQMFTNLVQLFVTTCNPALAQRNLRRVDFPRVLNTLPTQQMRDNLQRAYANTFVV